MDYDIIIVGAGPGGLATALHLAHYAPELARRTLIIESKKHPRRKLCGGGVTFHGEAQLRQLGVNIEVPAAVVGRIVFRLGTLKFVADCARAMRVVQRAEFDAGLAAAVQCVGIPCHDEELLVDLQVDADGVEIRTSKRVYRAKVVIAADGSKSIVRSRLTMRNNMGIARLLHALTPVNTALPNDYHPTSALFDFSPIQHGIQGYLWDFPCIVNDQPYMNRGIFDSRLIPDSTPRTRGGLKQVFLEGLAAREVSLEDLPLEGHPVRWFDPQGDFSQPRVLLVGDAAGVDPLFAEGISYAMEYGAVATQTVISAFTTGDFGFGDYKIRLLNHPLGKMLGRRTAVAKRLYDVTYWRWWQGLWGVAAVAPRIVKQAVGAALGVLPPVQGY